MEIADDRLNRSKHLCRGSSRVLHLPWVPSRTLAAKGFKKSCAQQSIAWAGKLKRERFIAMTGLLVSESS